MPALSEGPMCKQAPSSAIRAPAGYKCQKLVTVAVNTKSRMVQLGNLPRHFWFIQITGKVQLPSLAGNYFSLRAAVEAEHLWAVWWPHSEPLEEGVLSVSCTQHPVLVQIALARAHTFSCNKDVWGWTQKVLPYLPVGTEGTKQQKLHEDSEHNMYWIGME